MNDSVRLSLSSPNGQQEFILEKKEAQTSLAEIMARRGHPLNTRCGQRGICKGCVINLTIGQLLENTEVISAPAEIRSCQCHTLPGSEISVEAPARSLLNYEPRVMADFAIGIPFGHDPLFETRKGETRLGLAIDIGTTTIVVLLVDMATGEILARASDFNRQIHFGDDVLTRIQLCSDDPTLLGKLQEAIVTNTLTPLIRQTCSQASVSPDDLAGITVAGNTTMLHFLAGEDPTPMGMVPFTPRFLEHKKLQTDQIGLDLDSAESVLPPLDIHLLPGLAAYVGADVTAGIFTTGMHFKEKPTLFTDIGTNGEIVLKYGDCLLGCATAAGPAFEGSGLSCGMRAVDGAIEHIRLREPPDAPICQLIEQNPSARRPVGLCGSAYIDFLAEGRRMGLLNESGRFDAAFCATLRQEFVLNTDDGKAFSLNPKLKDPITISERDIAHLLQAKAAIAAGIEILLTRAGITPDDVDKLTLAGGFGFHIDISNAIVSGLLPGFHPDQIEVVGNTSLAGAYVALLDRNSFAEMESIRKNIEIVELNLDPEFEDRYIDHLSLS